MRRIGLIPKEEAGKIISTVTTMTEDGHISAGYIDTEPAKPAKPAKSKDIKIGVKEAEDA